MYFIFWYDYVLLPVYLILVISLLNFYFRRRHGYDAVLKKHFKRALTLKFVGCIAIGLIYELYYTGSYDGRFYFECAKMLTSYWSSHPSDFFHSLFAGVNDFNQTNLSGLLLDDVNIFADESFVVGKIAALFNVASFNAFLPCSIFFCAVSFIAIWNLFIFFREEYKLTHQIAGLSTIYVPSILIWSSSIFKDTVTFTALCWVCICGYYAFVKPKKMMVNLVMFLACIYLITLIKVYIIAAFIPFFIIYIFNSYKNKIKNAALRQLSTPFIIMLGVGGVFVFLQNAGELLGKYSVDQVLETATQTSKYIAEVSAGSAYTMNVDFSSPLGLLQALPAGINVTLFRPYPWEYLKPFTLLASIESMIMLYFTVKIIRKLGIKKTFQLISRTPILQLSLFFTLLFAFMVGISSSNFGTLVRYKIPCLPFYCLFLGILYQQAFPQKIKTAAVKKNPMADPIATNTISR